MRKEFSKNKSILYLYFFCISLIRRREVVVPDPPEYSPLYGAVQSTTVDVRCLFCFTHYKLLYLGK